jgi:glutathione S-transferase
MILFYTPNSPFARTARIALREWGMIERAEERPAANRQADNPVLEFNPVGRVPTLVDGTLVLTEAQTVFAYVKARARGDGRTPVERRDWGVAAVEGQAVGFLEGIAAWVRENRRDAEERSAFLLAVGRDRMLRCLRALESLAAAQRLSDVREYRGAALASALQLMSLHRFCERWESAHPSLADWLSQQASRPSMRQTEPAL